jgi:hypothetical protein
VAASDGANTAARLATSVIDDGVAGRAEPLDVDDFELLTGAKDAERTALRPGLAASGGLYTFLILLVLNSLDELEAATMTVLAPDIRDAFGVSDGVIVFIS